MAEGKKSFVLYCDLISTVQKMPIEKAGELFMTILKYVNDKEPEVTDLLVEVVFEPIKLQLKRDLKHWESIKCKRSEAGKASAESKKQKSTSVESVQQDSTNSTVTVTVTDTVINTNTLDKDFKSINCLDKKSKKSVSKKIDLDDFTGFDGTQTEKYLKFRTWLNEKYPRVSSMNQQMSIKQYFQLTDEFKDSTIIVDYLNKMENWSTLLTKNQSVYLTIVNWLRDHYRKL
jgi:hypothetical protein